MAPNDPSPSPWQRRTGLAVAGFVLLTLAGATITDAIYNPIVSAGRSLFCPHIWFGDCPSPGEATFKPSDVSGCQSGRVGGLIRSARNDGDIETRNTDAELLAEKAHVCDETAGPSSEKAVEVLRWIGRNYDGCFAYDQKTPAPAGDRRGDYPSFSLNLDDDRGQLCASGVQLVEGKCRIMNSENQGRIFCFPKVKIDEPVPSSIDGLRRCSQEELERIGVLDWRCNWGDWPSQDW